MGIKTLQYWHKVEHFYPYLVGEQSNPNIKSFAIDSPERFGQFLAAPLPPEKTVKYYAVYLGLFRVDKALEALEQGMGKKMRFRDSGDDESCFCTFTMSAEGAFNPNSFKISSFPWAIHRVREGKIIIDHWDDDFHSFEKRIFTRLLDHDGPLDYAFLSDLRDGFSKGINWDIAYCDHWLRIDRVIGDASGAMTADDGEIDTVIFEPPAFTQEEAENREAEAADTDEQVKQNDLLNSFYIRDLERMIDSLKNGETAASDCFRRYLSHGAEERIDVEKDGDTLLALLSPRLLPKGKWPSSYGLRLMQQVDVNAFLCSDPAFHQSLFSVNGPPGTGKTTLLKDIIAAIVVARAMEMCALAMPDDAFGDIVCEIETVTARGVYKNAVRDVMPALKQYGILVTSNNNGAVENVTHTLPALSEIAPDYIDDTRHYFSQVSDLLFGEGKTWAMNAAALGNKRNRLRFIDAFWPINPEHTNYNFNARLREKVKTPSPQEWEEAKQDFKNALAAVEEEYQKAEAAYACLQKRSKSVKELSLAEENYRVGQDILASFQSQAAEQKERIAKLEKWREHIKARLKGMEESQPAPLLWLKKLFAAKSSFMRKYRSLENELLTQVEDLHTARNALQSTEENIHQLQMQLEQWRQSIVILHEEISQTEKELAAFQRETASPLRIDAYFEKTRGEAADLSSPWGYEALNQCRARLFMEAMALHRAFVQNARYLRDNLDAFSKMMRGRIPVDQLPLAAPTLLQSFMLVTPVVSTTFASVGTFLRHIPQGEIAYLFIDEAGQAMPQAAAGAIWRARNVIAVGDPLQIEPVVTLHDSVLSALAEHYGQDEILANKYTSVQSLADMSNRLGGFRTISSEDDLWIGAPLVVHNRCQKHVFDIANKIAYNEKMIHATKERPGAKRKWLHVSGNNQDGHYVPAQAEAICDLLVDAFARFEDERDDSQKYPAIFVISPFRSVSGNMRTHFRKNLPVLLRQRNIDVSPAVVRKWLKDCIGTIHTFQGKETDTVVLCLGVDSGGKNMGAVDWACERPNILNVAVTRSKEHLYIVGDKNIWAHKPFFKTAYEICAGE